MLVYFTASIVGKRHYLSNYLKVVDFLKGKNFKVLSGHIIDTDESQIRMESKEERYKFQSQLEKWITSCDFMVAETSFPSISVGYEIALASSRGKPVLILYNQGKAPSLLQEYRNEKLVCEKYTMNTMGEIINDFVNYVEGIDDTKFTFFIPTKIAVFLDKISKSAKIPKSVYLRQLIEKEMKDNNGKTR